LLKWILIGLALAGITSVTASLLIGSPSALTVTGTVSKDFGPAACAIPARLPPYVSILLKNSSFLALQDAEPR